MDGTWATVSTHESDAEALRHQAEYEAADPSGIYEIAPAAASARETAGPDLRFAVMRLMPHAASRARPVAPTVPLDAW